MLREEEQSKEGDTDKPGPKLVTEGPLFEKDRQAMAMERARKLGEEALEQWRRLKQKISNKFKK